MNTIELKRLKEWMKAKGFSDNQVSDLLVYIEKDNEEDEDE